MDIGKPIVEHERDGAWDDVYATFPNADYIESF